MSEINDNAGTTRRELLQKSAVTVAAGVAATTVSHMPATAEGMARVIGANDRINVGHIGIGVQGTLHLRLIKENAKDGLNNNTEQIGVCDIYTRARKGGQATLGIKDSQVYDDHRKLLENKDIDAVWVTTSDQWHAPITIDAVQAGKHVYCEKPMTRTIEEAFAVFDAVKKSGKIFQIGSQGTSDGKHHAVGALVKAGKIGKLIVGQDSYCRADNKKGEWNDYRKIDPDAGPTATGDAYINWDVFCKGKKTPWDADRFFHWRKWWDYGSGLMGDLLPHRLHPLMYAMAIPTEGTEGYPIRVSSTGGLYVQKINPASGKPDREVPDFMNLMVDFGDYSLMAMTSCVTEQGWPSMIRGNKATIVYNGGNIELKPEHNYTDEIDGDSTPAPGPTEDIRIHEKNFLDCIRANKPTNGNIDLATRVQVMVSLGELSYRQGHTFHFNPKTRAYGTSPFTGKA